MMDFLRTARTRLETDGWATVAMGGGFGVALALYLWAAASSAAGSSLQLPFPLVLVALGIYELVSRKQMLNRSPVVGWLLLILTAMLLGAKLYKIWSGGISGGFSIAGFVPQSDAYGYLQGARNLLEHGFLDEWSARKPMVANYYALLLLATGQNLMAVIVVNVAILILSIYLFCRWIFNHFGIVAALLALLLQVYFILPFAPTTMTEIPGLCFGNFGFLLLAQGAFTRRKGAFALGLGLLGVAFTLRAGALFVLPALALAAGRIFAAPRTYSIPMVALCVGAIALPFLLNMAELRLAGPPTGGVLGGNFSYTLYGIIKGNKGWDYVKTEHPELMELSDSQRSRMIYGLVRQELREKPFALFVSLAEGYRDILIHPFARLYPWYPFPVELTVFLMPFIYFFVMLAYEKDEGRRRLLVALGAALGGIVLSLPFLVDVGYRVFAATVAMTGGVLAIGMKGCLERLRRCDAPPVAPSASRYREAYVVPVVLLALMLCMPAVGKTHRAFRRPDPAGADVPPETVPVRIHKGSILHVVSDDAATRIPQIRWADFQRQTGGSCPVEDPAIRGIQPGEWLASGVVSLQEGARFFPYVIFEDPMLRDGIAYCRMAPVAGSRLVYRAQVVAYAADGRGRKKQ